MKKKLNLNELKVKSFVTDFDKNSAFTVKGGLPNTNVNCTAVTCPVQSDQVCPPSAPDFCQTAECTVIPGNCGTQICGGDDPWETLIGNGCRYTDPGTC